MFFTKLTFFIFNSDVISRVDYAMVYNPHVGWWRRVPLLGVNEIWILLEVNNSRSHLFPLIQFMISDEMYMDLESLNGRLEVALQNQLLIDFQVVHATSNHFKTCDGCLNKNTSCDLYNEALKHYVYCKESECKICKSARPRLSQQVIQDTKVYNGKKQQMSYNHILSDFERVGG